MADGVIVEHANISVIHVAGLDSAFVATGELRAGELLLREKPLLVATPLHALTTIDRDSYRAGAVALGMELDDLLIVHAFARAPSATRERVLTECCGAEVCTPCHSIVQSACTAAAWCQEHDEACASLPRRALERVLCVFALNAFGYLADGLTGGATSLYPRSAKFTHRCLSPSVVFHGQEASLCFRATRDIEAGEVLTISYLGAMAHCGALRRRRLLYESKGLVCGRKHEPSPSPSPCPRPHCHRPHCHRRPRARLAQALSAAAKTAPPCPTYTGSYRARAVTPRVIQRRGCSAVAPRSRKLRSRPPRSRLRSPRPKSLRSSLRVRLPMPTSPPPSLVLVH